MLILDRGLLAPSALWLAIGDADPRLVRLRVEDRRATAIRHTCDPAVMCCWGTTLDSVQ